jgi:hypothetical protein
MKIIGYLILLLILTDFWIIKYFKLESLIINSFYNRILFYVFEGILVVTAFYLIDGYINFMASSFIMFISIISLESTLVNLNKNSK